MLHRELVFLPSKHLTVGVSVDIMSRPCKRPRLLQPGEISELVFDTDSDESRLSSDISSVEGGFESVSGSSQPQTYRQTASSHESSSSISSSASEEEDAGENNIIIIFINCNWYVTRWQWLIYMYTNMKKSN